MYYDVIIVGGGAAGFFTAINAAEKCPDLKIAILERGASCLEKVRISGGGRCNVAHGEFMPKPLSLNYPRGEKELLGPFHHFMSGDTMAWFEDRGVPLKIEEDGRVFPTSDSSQSIIACFMEQADKYEVDILVKHALKNIVKEDKWKLETSKGTFTAQKLVLATGSNAKIWKLTEALGHHLVPPVPSLFTFNCNDPCIKHIPGLSTPVEVELYNLDKTPVKTAKGNRADRGGWQGPLLITHWGFSGPAILKLSAWAARDLYNSKYQFKIKINWLPNYDENRLKDELLSIKSLHPRQQLTSTTAFELPKRLWQALLTSTGIPEDRRWADLKKNEMLALSNVLIASFFTINGKSTFKEEFVTAGGVDLKEVNFKTFESKKVKELYFAGEILNIDAITGGFNFQNAWTGGYLVAQAIAKTALKAEKQN